MQNTATRQDHRLRPWQERPDIKGNFVVRITRADVGSRVSVRSRLRDSAAGPSTTDTVGYLRAWTDEGLRIERRDGTVALIAEADLLAGKILPHPPPERRRGLTC